MISKALKKRNRLSVSRLCAFAEVSKSGYYSWRGRPQNNPSEDEKEIIHIYEKSGQLMGYRRLKMEFEKRNSRTINIKKVRRIKRDFGLLTRVRKASKFRAIGVAGHEHSVVENIVKRNFSDPESVILSIDITELKYRGGQRAYMIAGKLLGSNEIEIFEIGISPSIDFVLKPFRKYFESIQDSVRKRMIVHSDQGFQFTHQRFRELLMEFGIRQSMSRKGNCLDNAPIESFFGHMKDEVPYKYCLNLSDLKTRLKKYVDYYNNERPQWGLKRKTPAEAGVIIKSLFY